MFYSSEGRLEGTQDPCQKLNREFPGTIIEAAHSCSADRQTAVVQTAVVQTAVVLIDKQRLHKRCHCSCPSCQASTTAQTGGLLTCDLTDRCICIARCPAGFLRSLTHCHITAEVIIPNQITSAVLTQVWGNVWSGCERGSYKALCLVLWLLASRGCGALTRLTAWHGWMCTGRHDDDRGGAHRLLQG